MVSCRHLILEEQGPTGMLHGWWKPSAKARIMEADCSVLASPMYFWTISSKLKAFIKRFYCIAEKDPDPPPGRYERYPDKDCTLLYAILVSTTWACCLQAAAATPTASPG